MADEEPDYKVYRSRPRLLRRRPEEDGLAELRGAEAPKPDGEPAYEVHGRRGPRLPSLPKRAPRLPGRRRPITPGRVLTWVAIALVAWIGVSAILFMVS